VEGKQNIINIYGSHLSDGTVFQRRMASAKYVEAPQKGVVAIRLPQLNICLYSTNKVDVVKRGRVISTLLLLLDPSGGQNWGTGKIGVRDNKYLNFCSRIFNIFKDISESALDIFPIFFL
jgi:hypothetical protein